MKRMRAMLCGVLAALMLAGCGGVEVITCQSERPAPAAWAMLPAPDLLTPLNGIISPSESESSQ